MSLYHINSVVFSLIEVHSAVLSSTTFPVFASSTQRARPAERTRNKENHQKVIRRFFIQYSTVLIQPLRDVPVVSKILREFRGVRGVCNTICDFLSANLSSCHQLQLQILLQTGNEMSNYLSLLHILQASPHTGEATGLDLDRVWLDLPRGKHLGQHIDVPLSIRLLEVHQTNYSRRGKFMQRAYAFEQIGGHAELDLYIWTRALVRKNDSHSSAPVPDRTSYLLRGRTF